ncbi:MAG: hypothetical protein J1F35_08100 [Erysipelotrichales bacterium]|nr:hypothetical protein [Erysipelotrichales bacterium]
MKSLVNYIQENLSSTILEGHFNLGDLDESKSLVENGCKLKSVVCARGCLAARAMRYFKDIFGDIMNDFDNKSNGSEYVEFIKDNSVKNNPKVTNRKGKYSKQKEYECKPVEFTKDSILTYLTYELMSKPGIIRELIDAKAPREDQLRNETTESFIMNAYVKDDNKLVFQVHGYGAPDAPRNTRPEYDYWWNEYTFTMPKNKK